MNYPIRGIKDLLIDEKGRNIISVKTWEEKKLSVQNKLRWAFGKEPSGVINMGPKSFINGGIGENYFGNFLQRPETNDKMGKMALTPYDEFGDYLYGDLYYPKNKEEVIKKGKCKLPVVIYLHEFDYSKGFSSQRYDHEIQPFFEALVAKWICSFLIRFYWIWQQD